MSPHYAKVLYVANRGYQNRGAEMLEVVSKTTFAESEDDHSRAEVSVKLDTDNGWLNNSLSISVHADPNAEPLSEVWISMRAHNYTSLEDSKGRGSSSRGFDLISQHLSREEAEALLAVLSNELKKFKVRDEAEQPVFI